MSLKTENKRFRISLFQGLLPLEKKQIPAEVIAGLTLAALAIPELMGYTKIAGVPVITVLYTILIPMILFAIFSSSRHLVVGADSATAAILAAGMIGIASTGTDEYLALAGVLALMSGGFLILARIIGLGFFAGFFSRTVLSRLFNRGRDTGCLRSVLRYVGFAGRGAWNAAKDLGGSTAA